MSNEVRVRFAPSPTGHLHLGGARTALFNFLFARTKGGKFILRIEDTDASRTIKGAAEEIIVDLQQLKLNPDNIFYQSNRIDKYQENIELLLEKGLAFISDGAVKFQDRVLRRSDGSPTYNLCVVVDDHDMEISHVMRGDDHISNTKHQSLLYDALGWEKPVFIHLPQVLGKDGKRLSKRDVENDLSVRNFLNKGIHPTAITNYLLRLGWGKGDMEIFSLEDAIEHFDLRGVRKSPSRFDQKKLEYLNRVWQNREGFSNAHQF